MKIINKIFIRATIMVFFVILEIGFLVSLFLWFNKQFAWIEPLLRLLGVLIVLAIIVTSQHLSSDLMWIILIMVLPIAGTVTYLLLGANLVNSRTFKSLLRSTKNSYQYYEQDPAILDEIVSEDPARQGQFKYISSHSRFPFYHNTGFDYYKFGELGYPTMLEEMRKAQKYIFLEYFIIEEGKMWNGMLEILEEKAKEGLDVRVMYDDMGSFSTLSLRYADHLEAKGIKCQPFNRINPIVGTIMNHRDHRKIMVIDGQVAFSGGVNLADEYINEINRFGVWKDNIIKITGEAVWSYTVMFLSHWNALRQDDDSYLPFKAEALPGEADGYIAPYGETPLSRDITAQNIYVNILNQAQDYCYIYTPYLIIDTDLSNALTLAAKRGVDVKILIPGIPDKKIIYSISRSYYPNLIKGGVKMYEYTPGFVHSKVFVSDDTIATVGTINLDYRSLYLHFENGTYLYRSKKVKEVKEDFLEALALSHEVTLSETRRGFFYMFFMSVLRVFTPMM
ncbi:MAG: cardiolipin synthase [bacterium]